jgi:large subunit ribosomal protein L24
MKIKQGDTVKMISGKDKGRSGTVVRVIPSEDRVVVEGLNMVKRHTKKSSQQKESGIVSKPAAVGAPKVQLVCPKCGRPTRVKLTREDGKKIRKCMKCKSIVDGEKAKAKAKPKTEAAVAEKKKK